LEEALEGATLVVPVIPTHGLRDVLPQASKLIHPEAFVLSATKGVEQGTLKLVSQVFEELLPPAMHERLTFLGGPSFAKEVAARLPSAVIVAGSRAESTKAVQSMLTTDRFRAYTTDDVVGVELGGALKNVIAIAAGIADGLGYGSNTRAALITRGLAEISRLAIELGAHPLTLAGLGGMGDLVLTCTGDLSRNRRVGMELGRGRSLEDILGETSMVAEGVRTAKSAYELAVREGIDMPITREVYSMLYEGKPPAEVVATLMGRPLRAERG
ncbi:MAG: NAD(P)-dependent glycerol-3-phosphate dehydrogenase, partial [Polyangiaceae bacterium]|nr:NAD(P)-dependent glycerol-3-phosphate dehydrogenase [Polyangiaceae bacterium]